MYAKIVLVSEDTSEWTHRRPTVTIEVTACVARRVHVVSSMETMSYAGCVAWSRKTAPDRVRACDGCCQPVQLSTMRVLPELDDAIAKLRVFEPSASPSTEGRVIRLNRSGRCVEHVICTGQGHLVVTDAWGSSVGPVEVRAELCPLHPCRPFRIRLPRSVEREVRKHLRSAEPHQPIAS